MRSRRAASKGNEWLLIKKRDDQAEEGYDAEQYDNSALTNRTMREIAASTMPSGQPPAGRRAGSKPHGSPMPSPSSMNENKPRRQPGRITPRKNPERSRQKSRRILLPAKHAAQSRSAPCPTESARRAKDRSYAEEIHPMLATASPSLQRPRLALRNQMGWLSRHRLCPE